VKQRHHLTIGKRSWEADCWRSSEVRPEAVEYLVQPVTAAIDLATSVLQYPENRKTALHQQRTSQERILLTISESTYSHHPGDLRESTKHAGLQRV
jgi:response regulator of citrate/malate metabolism